MVEKTIKCRLVQKHDVQSNWEVKKDFIPKQGEMIVYDIDDNYNYERMKIGDGKTVIGALPFVDDPIRTLIENLDNDKLDAAELPYAIDDALTKAKDGGEFDGADGADGVTFTPAVDAEGNLSWTNDGDLANPETVNIRGTQGLKGDDGADGTTFTPKVSTKGELSWTNNGGLPNPAPFNIMGFVYKGSNPLATKGLEQDTREFWAGQGSGYWWIAGNDNVKEQPTQYGYILNLCYGTGESYQVFFGAALNIISVRSGGAGATNADGWYRNTGRIWRDLVFADTLTNTTTA